MTKPHAHPSITVLLLLLAACSSTGNGTGGSRDAGAGGGTAGSGGFLGSGGAPGSGGAGAGAGETLGVGGSDAGAWTDSVEHRDAGPTTPDAPVEARPPADSQSPLVATGIACTDINLSCYERYNYYCTEYANADDATVTDVEAHCASVEGIFARGTCPAGMTSGCAQNTVSPCRNVWYYNPFSASLIGKGICPSTLLLP
jgi:hypothetical protein